MSDRFPPPLGGPPPAEVVLRKSPLVRVVAQVRFSSVLRIETREAVTSFQDKIRSAYPHFSQVAAQQLQLDLTSGVPNLRPATISVWRFSNADRSMLLSLTSEVVTLEAKTYHGRSDFVPLWSEILSCLQQVFQPALAVRTGIRYVNRLDKASLERLTEWVQPNLVGVALPEIKTFVTQAFSEASIKVEEGDLQLRWGILPANATTDPGLLDPIPETSWVLDLDVSSPDQKPFEVAALTAEFGTLAKRAYAVFRWAITKAGLEHFGAEA